MDKLVAGAPQWPQVEDGFWQSLQSTYEAEDKMLADEYKKTKASIQKSLNELYHERAAMAERFRRVETVCAAQEARMETLQLQYEDSRRVRFAMRDSTVAKMKQWFNSNSGNNGNNATINAKGRANGPSAAAAAAMSPPTPGFVSKMMQTTKRFGTDTGSPRIRAAPLSPAAAGERREIQICDAAGNVLGPLLKTRTRNALVDAVCDGAVIKRPIVVRTQGRFTPHNVSLLYTPSDNDNNTSTKWVACMIQATGDVQPRKCASCVKLQGPFDECVVLARDGFAKCGNCEWGRMDCCHARTGPLTRVVGGGSRGQQIDRSSAPAGDIAMRSPVNVPVQRPTSSPRPIGPHSRTGTNIGGISTSSASFATALRPAATVASPRPASVSSPHARPSTTIAGATSNPRKRPFVDGQYLAHPSHGSGPIFVEPDNASPPADGEYDMITLQNLMVKHDGTVYLEPESIRGVPVAKIEPGHAYWEPSWVDLEAAIRPQYEKWLAKQTRLMKDGGATQQAKFQVDRQVNRGVRILDFLARGPISPYQLLAKRFVTGAGVFSYDTLFRLVNTLDELAQLNQTVPPVDWLRHRLHELVLEQGSVFDLGKTMHGFYHDPKLAALRKCYGLGRLGPALPPSAVMNVMRARQTVPTGDIIGSISRGDSGNSISSNIGESEALVKRRRTDSYDPRRAPATPTPAPGSAQSITHKPTPSLLPSPSPSPAQRKLGTCTPPNVDVAASDSGAGTPQAIAAAAIDAATASEDDGNATDVDSNCGDSIEPTDFRIVQLKHRLAASDPLLTQYLHWLDDGEDRCLQHQVLARRGPNVWGMYRESHSLCVNLDEVLELRCAADPRSTRVELVMDAATRCDDGRPRGNVLAEFKRRRTLARFKSFMVSRGVAAVEISRESVDSCWDEMKAQMVPGGEASIDV